LEDLETLKRLEIFVKANPTVTVIDPLIVLDSMMYRSHFLTRCRETLGHGVEWNGVKIRPPWFRNSHAGFSDLDSLHRDMAEYKINFPLLIKNEV
jgi:hypothetical protein